MRSGALTKAGSKWSKSLAQSTTAWRSARSLISHAPPRLAFFETLVETPAVAARDSTRTAVRAGRHGVGIDRAERDRARRSGGARHRHGYQPSTDGRFLP